MNNNLVKPKQLIIIGGGTSINDGIALGLKDKLKDRFVIGCNYAFEFFDCTLTACVDHSFYNPKVDQKLWTQERKEAHVNKLKNLPMVIAQGRGVRFKHPNTAFIKCALKYDRTCQTGIYKSNLCGCYALTLGIYLLDEGEIFLLGMDFGAITDEKIDDKKATHFYQKEFKHRGTGKNNWYEKQGRDEMDYGVYREEKKCKIWNVSPNSNIRVFDKITYEEMFNKLDNQTFNQDELRAFVTEKTLHLPHTEQSPKKF